VQAVVRAEDSIGRGPERDVVDVDHRDAARRGELGVDRVVPPDRRRLRGRVAVVRAGRGHGVVRRGHDEHPVCADAPDELVEDVRDVAAVGRFRHVLDDVVHPDQEGHELGTERRELRQLHLDDVR